MRALTVQQPWAWAIVHGGKDVENRTQAWTYRGPLAIHAGMRFSERGAEHPRYRFVHAMSIAAVRHRVDLAGFILGVVELVDVHVAEDGCCESEWAETEYAEYAAGDDSAKVRRDIVHLVLERPRPLHEPIPAKGRLGLWTPDLELLDRIREQVPA